MIASRSSFRVVLLLLAAGSIAGACTDEFPLGGWDAAPPDTAGSSGSDTSGGSGATGGAGPSAGTDASGGNAANGASGGSQPSAGATGASGTVGTAGDSGNAGRGSITESCLEPGVPGPTNQPGSGVSMGVNVGTTDTISDFVWPEPMDSMEWELMVETPLERDGYYWMNQFSFTGTGTVGYFGMQERGGYSTVPNPRPSDYEFTKMVVFWISSPGITQEEIPDRAELGDIEEPDARIMPDANGNFITLHAKFAWETCRIYRLRVGVESIEENGDRWLGGWILDVEANEETFFGRIRLAPDAGQFVPFNSLRTTPIERAPFASCEDTEPVSALFGWPTGNLGTMTPDSRNSHFPLTTRCGSSRFTLFPTSVRHELGLQR